MKILYITLENLSFHKGSVVHIKEIVTGLRKLGHQMGLVASSWSKFEKVDHFYNLNHTPNILLRFFKLKKQPYLVSSLFLFLHLLKILPRYDIIYARDFHTVIIALFPRLIFKKKLIFEINGIANEEQRLNRPSVLNRIMIFLIQKGEMMATRYSDRIVSVTPQIASYLIRYFYCQEDKVEVVGNGVDTKKFFPIHDEAILAEWRKRWGISKEERIIAFIGNLARWQGVDLLIESAFRFLEKEEKLKFLIVGDGPLKRDLLVKVLKSKFEKEFIFTGTIDYEDVPFLINMSDICVAPFISRRNRTTGVSPLKVFEYMACGKPVITSRIEGLEFIESEGVGLLVDPEDMESFEEAISDLLKNFQKGEDMGRKGLQIANNRFNWDSKVAKIEKILKELA